jgi:predicted transposase YbfD/YdcC
MAFNENKILTFARTLPEHRMDRKKLHLAEDIVFITLVAVICGADTWEEIAEFGRSKKGFLRSILSLKNGIPSPDTFNRFFAGLNPKVFETLFLSWAQGLCKHNSGVIAIDGKTVRGSRKEGGKSAIHMVSAFSAANNLVLGQVKTNQKSNEITAIPELIKVLDIEGCIVTIDAMGCQTKIAKAIIDQGADYLLAVKENQKELYSNIIDTFRFTPKEKLIQYEDIDTGHGRVETRLCTVTNNLGQLSRVDDWEHINALVKIESVRYIKVSGITQNETRYYITSLNHNTKTIGQAVRSHWSIENNLHWQLDVSFNEDKSRKRDRNAAENYSVILRMALNLIKNEKSTKRSVKGKRLKAGWDNEYLLTLLNF